MSMVMTQKQMMERSPQEIVHRAQELKRKGKPAYKKNGVLLDHPNQAPPCIAPGGWLKNRAYLLAPDGVPTVVVAAHDSPEIMKQCADFICDGVNDEETIMEAIEAVHRPNNRSPVKQIGVAA